MDNIVLQNSEMQAEFSPDRGMNLLRLAVGNLELIDQNTKPLFVERFAGLGSLIGPHFHHRPKDEIPPVVSEELFPHIARVRAKGVIEPFSHGIARYAPWTARLEKNSIQARLSGNDVWNGVSLASLEGFSFEINLIASLLKNGLALDYSVESERASVIGLHYYYTLPSSGGIIRAQVEPQYRVQDIWQPIPASFLNQDGSLYFDAMQECDFGFIPKKGKDGFFEIFYENAQSLLRIRYQTDEKEASWQLYRPKGATYICIEPLSARNPKTPILKKSRIYVEIDFLLP
jgi:hypothetical protein